ncbi:MAG: hypothetical protein PGN27_25075 [Mycolicibacterium neoaurum]|uniref:hypothetical protein n=1 Tax=Mycolicibacterium neoaurum TaxID=1795 RepID=UPI002FFB2DD1
MEAELSAVRLRLGFIDILPEVHVSHAAESISTAIHESLIGGPAHHLGKLGRPSTHLALFGDPAPHNSLVKSLADLNRDHAPAMNLLNRDMAKALEPFHREIGRILADTARLPVAHLVDTEKVMAPFQALMDKHVAETVRRLAPITERARLQMPELLGSHMQMRLAELAAIAGHLVTGVAAEKIEQVSLEVPNARPRTPSDIVVYIELCIVLITFLITILQYRATLNQQPSDGGTVNQTINYTPTTVINKTTVVIQPPVPTPPPG